MNVNRKEPTKLLAKKAKANLATAKPGVRGGRASFRPQHSSTAAESSDGLSLSATARDDGIKGGGGNLERMATLHCKACHDFFTHARKNLVILRGHRTNTDLLQDLFADLDQQYFSGCIGAAGYHVSLQTPGARMYFIGADGRPDLKQYVDRSPFALGSLLRHRLPQGAGRNRSGDRHPPGTPSYRDNTSIESRSWPAAGFPKTGPTTNGRAV